MDIKRRSFSELVTLVSGFSEGGLSLVVTNGGGHGRYVEIRHVSGTVLAGCYFNDFFDGDGNRFEDDLP